MLRSKQNVSCLALFLLVLLLAKGAQAQSVAAQDARQDTASQSQQAVDMNEVMVLLRQQQQELAEQRRLLETQAQQISTLTRELDTLRKPPVTPAVEQVVDSDSPVPPPTATSTTPAAVPTVANAGAPTVASANAKIGKSVSDAQTDDPTREMLKDFKGAWRLPGTNAALSIGGFVKTAAVYNNDPLQIADRFIVGSIPVGESDGTKDVAQSSITADQSRLNFDLREPTKFGLMRGFVEGDFADDGENFRLRHAFGQWNRMLAGKTWSTFVDPEASPEELDFEGLNARVNVRQSQIRFMPRFGEEYELQFALEDPNPEIDNGSGVNRTPDIVLAGRFSPRERLHTKLSLLARQLRAQETTGGVTEEYGWGVSLSGSYATPNFDERDKLFFQINRGNGIGRYVNDLSSIGNYDGIFDPTTGDLQLFDVTAGYASWQHWWDIEQLRSNFTFGMVDVNNPDFLTGDAYQRTLRFSSNLIWSPISRIDIGGEYLWGSRENEDGESGDANQLQFAVKYRF